MNERSASSRIVELASELDRSSGKLSISFCEIHEAMNGSKNLKIH